MLAALHSCYLCTFDQELNYDGGSVIFEVGETCTGATSHASGTVKSVSGTSASGYLVLSNVSGTYQNDETIAGSGATPGAAVANGANTTYVDSYGKKTQTAAATATSCHFFNPKAPSGQSEYGWSGRFPAVRLPSGTTLLKPSDYAGALQRLTSTETGFSGTFEIQWPPIYRPNAAGDVQYIICALKAVTA